jgi:hypothetical protein
MKVTLPDLTTIDCTVDEYEELIARGLVGKKLDDLKVELEGQDGEKIVIPSTPKKQPYQNWPGVVALYGCEIAQNPYNGSIDVKFEHNAYTTTDGVQKLNSVVINDASNTDEE